MHSVSRGDAPKELAPIAKKYTPKWVVFYEKKQGKKPSDSHWRKFEPLLKDRFQMLCGYCEEICKGEVDHFRPKSKFPRKVYRWENWVYSCHTCNNLKLEKWPDVGYIDPCGNEAPEDFFEFDTTTGEIHPKKQLTNTKLKRAKSMRDDLQLNAIHHLKERQWVLLVVEKSLAAMENEAQRNELVSLVTARYSKCSSIVRAFLSERGLFDTK